MRKGVPGIHGHSWDIIVIEACGEAGKYWTSSRKVGSKNLDQRHESYFIGLDYISFLALGPKHTTRPGTEPLARTKSLSTFRSRATLQPVQLLQSILNFFTKINTLFRSLCLKIGTPIGCASSMVHAKGFCSVSLRREFMVGNVSRRRHSRISLRRSDVAGHSLARTLELSQTIINMRTNFQTKWLVRSIDIIEKVENRLYYFYISDFNDSCHLSHDLGFME